ncbi:MAG: hypothetical protein ABEJ31_07735 [Haloarculaceae archaeon]
MSDGSLLAAADSAEPAFAFTTASRDQTSGRYDLDSVTVQGVTEDGKPVTKARLPLDEDGRAVISRDSFGDDAERARLVAAILEAEGWEYVEQ